MRSAQHRETLEVVKSLFEAQEEIRDALRQGRYAEAQIMLSECQEFAMALGESIEKTEGEEHVTVSWVEEYCESLYQVYQGISDGLVQENKIYRFLRQSLLKIENSIKNDIHIRREVVFFPYKAAMWDSLESIYLAAREDPDCDAYCVPIPYFDLKSDHSFGQMHYEGREYPSGIEVTDWQEYKFEERKPDVVYIHNAYDDWNLVTSVHPRFYSENLKQYTDKLVYVPYFVLGQINPADERAVERMKHFCFLPGIVYADRIILESEIVKKIYVSEYLKAAMVSGLSGRHLEKKYVEGKMLGLGSPKYDKILSTKSEISEIPKEWLQVIHKTDGTRKKVVLYNTGVASLLQYKEKWVKKIECSMRTFYKEKDAIALLWRPHPLIETTMEAMCPEILPRYLALKRVYLEEAWGIYDGTTDMNRAVALSNVYYGDNSSMISLYEYTGKPVLIQNADADMSICGEEKKNHTAALVYCNSAFYRGIEWFWSINLNALFGRDISSGKLKKVGRYRKCSGGAYNNTILYKEKIVLIPCRARDIMVFNVNLNKFHYVETGITDIKEECNLFYGYAVLNEYLFMAGNQTPYLLKFNMETEKVENVINLFPGGKKRNIYFRDIIISEKNMVIPMVEENIIFEVDTETLQWSCRKIGRQKFGFSSLCKVGNNIWLVPKENGEILEWYRNQDIVLEHKMQETEFAFSPAGVNFHSVIYLNNKLWLFPFVGNMVLSFDLKTGEISSDNAINRYLNMSSILKEKGYVCRSVQVILGDFYLLISTGELLIYESNEDKIKKCGERMVLDYVEYLYSQNIYVMGENEVSLASFLHCTAADIEDTEAQGQDRREEGDNYGSRIYKVTGAM